jgi:iron complex outermembrane recepter protein
MNRHVHESAARALLAGVLACVTLCWATLACAEEETRQYDIDIGQLPLSQALEAFSQQTGLQYGYLPTDEEEERLMVGPIQGRFTASQVLSKLLPVGFRFEWVNPRTISIVSPPVNAPPGGVNEAVAGKDQQRSELSKNQRVAMENGGGKSGSARGPYAFDWRVTVEGQRIFGSVFDSLDLDIPTTVFDREDIDALGVSTVTDLFQYVTQQPNLKPESYLGDGTQFADLRGLGFDSTLVLINGRRTVATASALTVNAFDLNTIPLGAVERVEIVSDSTSVIHGADSIGGVVNVVLRENIPEPRLDIDYGAAAGGAVERHVAFGASRAGRRMQGSIVLDYFDRSPLLGRERDRWNNQNFTRFGGMDWRFPTASPGNVSSATLENLPGLPSPFAAIPAASSGAVLTPADFVSTAGQLSLQSLLRYHAVTLAGTRKGAVAQGEYKFTPQLRGYGELLYVDSETLSQFEPPALNNELVSGANPYNPFGTDVRVNALLTDLGPRTFTRRTEMLRAAGGMSGRVREWDWEASFQDGRDDAVTVRTGELDRTRVTAALTTSDPRLALNMFGGSGSNTRALLASLLVEPAESRFRTEAIQSLVSARGPLTSLPAGTAELAIGAEWREERARYDMSPPIDVSGSHQRSIASAFGELRLPLLSQEAQLPAVHDLALVLSGRLDDYSDVGHTFNPEYALIWRPTSVVTLRTSLAKSFRPPPLFDLYMPPVDAPGPIVDLARNGEFALPIWRAGGNSELKPSSANSFSVGLRLDPRGPQAFRLGANYWRIAIDDTIAIPSATRLLAAEGVFPNRVLRGPPSAADIAGGKPGPLELIDIRRLNFGSLRTSGVDVSASVRLDTRAGRFKPELSGTWVHDYSTSDLVQGSDVSRTGIANVQGTIPRWRAAATLGWKHRGFGASGAVRYTPAYEDVDFLGNRNGRNVSSQVIVDAQFLLDLGYMAGEQSPWGGFEIRAGVFNLFDSEPPFSEVVGPAGFDQSMAQLKQRFAYVKIAKAF